MLLMGGVVGVKVMNLSQRLCQSLKPCSKLGSILSESKQRRISFSQLGFFRSDFAWSGELGVVPEKGIEIALVAHALLVRWIAHGGAIVIRAEEVVAVWEGGYLASWDTRGRCEWAWDSCIRVGSKAAKAANYGEGVEPLHDFRYFFLEMVKCIRLSSRSPKGYPLQ
jgi:hypothetical protein